MPGNSCLQSMGGLSRQDQDHESIEFAEFCAQSTTFVRMGTPVAQGGIDESTLQDLLFRHLRTLPIAAIDAAYDSGVPVCRELSTPAGYVDALYVNALGRLTLAEFKLWRNPQARREVIGQILDYGKEIASWSYEDLQREVSRALKRPGNVLFDLVRATDPDVEEGVFVDNVTRHLRRGEFLLPIIGDGIREGVENTVDFVQQHSGLHFNLALVEAAPYVKVRNSGFGDWGLSFVGYLYRSSPHIGCYLTCRKDIPQAVRVYEQIEASLPELRRKMGDDLRTWDSNPNAGSRIYMTRAIERMRPVGTAFEACPGIYRAIAGPKTHRKTYRQFSPGIFDRIVIDECHRGSAADDSAWWEIPE